MTLMGGLDATIDRVDSTDEEIRASVRKACEGLRTRRTFYPVYDIWFIRNNLPHTDEIIRYEIEQYNLINRKIFIFYLSPSGTAVWRSLPFIFLSFLLYCQKNQLFLCTQSAQRKADHPCKKSVSDSSPPPRRLFTEYADTCRLSGRQVLICWNFPLPVTVNTEKHTPLPKRDRSDHRVCVYPVGVSDQ